MKSYSRLGAGVGAAAGVLFLLILALRALLTPSASGGAGERGMAFLLSVLLGGVPLTLVVSWPMELRPEALERLGWLAHILLFAAFVANWSAIGWLIGAAVMAVRRHRHA